MSDYPPPPPARRRWSSPPAPSAHRSAPAGPSTSRQAANVVLPSIHDVFPPHLLPPPMQHAHTTPNPSAYQGVGQPLRHLSPPPFLGPRPVRVPPSLSEDEGDEEASDGSLDPEDSEAGRSRRRRSLTNPAQRKHVCNICDRRFNRPSSLKIHQNTHSGAMPFICPYPGCGRAFNVNSNMRRHYRNHLVPSGSPEAHSVGSVGVNLIPPGEIGVFRVDSAPGPATVGVMPYFDATSYPSPGSAGSSPRRGRPDGGARRNS